jgi:hypothetical protein
MGHARHRVAAVGGFREGGAAQAQGAEVAGEGEVVREWWHWPQVPLRFTLAFCLSWKLIEYWW